MCRFENFHFWCINPRYRYFSTGYDLKNIIFNFDVILLIIIIFMITMSTTLYFKVIFIIIIHQIKKFTNILVSYMIRVNSYMIRVKKLYLNFLFIFQYFYFQNSVRPDKIYKNYPIHIREYRNKVCNNFKNM